MSASPQSKDERLNEVSRATVDAKLWGAGFLMLFPDGSFKHIPLDRIRITPEKQPDQPAGER